MTYNIELNIRLLKAVALAASTEQTRYYLNGVNLEFDADSVIMCATDGKKLIAGKQKRILYRAGDSDEAAGEPSLILPLHMIAQIKVGKRSPDYATLSFDGKGDDKLANRALSLNYEGVTVSGAEIDGTFPHARAVIPREIDGVAAQFQPDFLLTFVKAAALCGVTTTPVVHHNGLSPALVSWLPDDSLAGCESFGVVMPMRMSDALPAAEWFINQAVVRKQIVPESVAA
jgi:DNA polymerase-3 subunit beta